MGKSPDKDDGSISDVDAHKHHSIKAMEALQRIMESLLEVRPEVRRDTVSRVLDYVHKLNQDYRKMANVFAPEEEFPDRAERWPEFFQKKDEKKEESCLEDQPCRPGLSPRKAHGKEEVIRSGRQGSSSE